MGLRLSAQARREVIQHMAPRYQEASTSLKAALLDETVATTGYARRYALRLLTHPPKEPLSCRQETQQFLSWCVWGGNVGTPGREHLFALSLNSCPNSR
jgi:hypothetical protein